MRPKTKPLVILAADRLEYSNCVNAYRRDQLEAMATNRGLTFRRMSGQWQGKPETSFVIEAGGEDTYEKARTLAREWNQDWIYRIYNDSSAYQVNVETGVESFKGFWKAVPPWRVVSFMKSGVDYTYDPDTNTYYTVGS